MRKSICRRHVLHYVPRILNVLHRAHFWRSLPQLLHHTFQLLHTQRANDERVILLEHAIPADLFPYLTPS